MVDQRWYDARDAADARAWQAHVSAVRGATLVFVIAWLWPYVGVGYIPEPGFADPGSTERFFWLVLLGILNAFVRVRAYFETRVILWF